MRRACETESPSSSSSSKPFKQKGFAGVISLNEIRLTMKIFLRKGLSHLDAEGVILPSSGKNFVLDTERKAEYVH